MSVRATERLVGDIVVVPGIPDSPPMVVRSVDIEAKLITTVWFSDARESQEGIFPASALDRLDVNAAAAEKKTNGAGKRANGKK